MSYYLPTMFEGSTNSLGKWYNLFFILPHAKYCMKDCFDVLDFVLFLHFLLTVELFLCLISLLSTDPHFQASTASEP